MSKKRQSAGAVNMSFLDLLSCALGGVILLMIIFTAIMYGKKADRKLFVFNVVAVGLPPESSLILQCEDSSPIEVKGEPAGEGIMSFSRAFPRPQYGEWSAAFRLPTAAQPSSVVEPEQPPFKKALDAVLKEQSSSVARAGQLDDADLVNEFRSLIRDMPVDYDMRSGRLLLSAAETASRLLRFRTDITPSQFRDQRKQHADQVLQILVERGSKLLDQNASDTEKLAAAAWLEESKSESEGVTHLYAAIKLFGAVLPAVKPLRKAESTQNYDLVASSLFRVVRNILKKGNGGSYLTPPEAATICVAISQLDKVFDQERSSVIRAALSEAGQAFTLTPNTKCSEILDLIGSGTQNTIIKMPLLRAYVNDGTSVAESLRNPIENWSELESVKNPFVWVCLLELLSEAPSHAISTQISTVNYSNTAANMLGQGVLQSQLRSYAAYGHADRLQRALSSYEAFANKTRVTKFDLHWGSQWVPIRKQVVPSVEGEFAKFRLDEASVFLVSPNSEI
jgi:hypothetical protein